MKTSSCPIFISKGKGKKHFSIFRGMGPLQFKERMHCPHSLKIENGERKV